MGGEAGGCCSPCERHAAIGHGLGDGDGRGTRHGEEIAGQTAVDIEAGHGPLRHAAAAVGTCDLTGVELGQKYGLAQTNAADHAFEFDEFGFERISWDISWDINRDSGWAIRTAGRASWR